MTAALHAERLDAIAAELDLPPAPGKLYRADRMLLHAAARAVDLNVVELLHATDRLAVRGRWLVATIGREVLRRSWTELGELLGRDHSTVIHGARRARELSDCDPDFAAALRHLADQFAGLGYAPEPVR